MLKAELPLSAGGELRHWPRQPEWRTLDLQRSKTTFDSFNWFMPLLTIPEAVQGCRKVILQYCLETQDLVLKTELKSYFSTMSRGHQ